MRPPVQRLCVAGDAIVCACCHAIILLDAAGQVQARSASADAHNAFVRLLLVDRNARLLISSGDDKLLKFWELPSLKLLKTQQLAKRATSIRFSADERHVLVADKFGDVYRFLSDATAETLPVAKLQPLLGHVSLLTALWPTSDGKRIVTADRDEHIRVSRYPESWDIVAFLGGHRRFVSALCAAGTNDTVLLSAGGDDELFIWDLSEYCLVARVDISPLADFGQVAAPRQDAMAKKFQYQQKRKGQAVEPEISPANSSLPVFRNLAVTKIIIFGDLVIVSAAGSSALLTFLLADAKQTCVLDLGQPVLDLCCQNGSVLVSLDRSRLPDMDRPPCSCILKRNDRTLVIDAAHSAYLDPASSVDGDAARFPDDEALYAELSYLAKDPAEASGYRDERNAAAHPPKTKVVHDAL